MDAIDPRSVVCISECAYVHSRDKRDPTGWITPCEAQMCRHLEADLWSGKAGLWKVKDGCKFGWLLRNKHGWFRANGLLADPPRESGSASDKG